MAEGTKVGSIYYEVGADDKKFKSTANSITSQLKSLAGVAGLTLGAAGLVGFLKQSITAFNEAQRVIAQTNAVIQSTGGVAGYTTEQIQKMAAEIQKTTTVSDEAAQQGMNMLLTFTKVGHEIFPQATQAIIDMATAMGGGLTPTGEELANTAIRIGKSLQDPILGVTALRRVGVNFNETQQDMIRNLVETGRSMDAQKYILAELSREFGGSAAAQAETFEGKMIQLKNRFNDLQESMGGAMIPALLALSDAFSFAGGSMNGLLIPIQVIATALIGLAYIAGTVARVLATVFSAAWKGIQGDFQGASQAIKNGIKSQAEYAVKTQERLTSVWKTETNKQTKIAVGGMKQQEDASGKKSAKVKKDLEEETDKYETELAKRNKNFKESLADLIWAHQDRIKDFEKQIGEESDNFTEKMEDRQKDFEEKMQDMKDEHQSKVDEINAQIDEEVAKGVFGSQKKIATLRAELATELAEYEKKRAREEADKLEADAKDQADHEKRLADLTTRMGEEKAILDAHQAEVAAVKDLAREDDIARLVRQHNEENAEADKQHQKRMVDIVAQNDAAGAAGGAAFNNAIQPYLDELEKKAEDAAVNASESMEFEMGEGGKKSGENLIKKFVNAIVNKAKEALRWTQGKAKELFTAISEAASLPHFASGVKNFKGGAAWVGERGPEIVRLPRGAEVIPNNQVGGQNITIYIDKVNNEQDIKSIGMELGYRAGIMPK